MAVTSSELKGRVEPRQIRDMFASVARRYDTANSVLSFGAHHRWRRSLVKWSGASEGSKVLDCATGTGDLALLFREVVGGSGAVIGSDFCEEMLAVAREKGQGTDVRFELGDVLQLKYADREFDVTSIAFGIRNVGDPVKGIRELARVTKPGGRVMILEFGEKQIPVWRECFSAFSRHILPRVGGWVTGQRTAYEYLQKSSSDFPCADDFLAVMRSTGAFRDLQFRSLFGGIVYVYRGVVG